ncbi:MULTISPECIES: hypothetical protein [unclassified Caballeronia]|uniref:hypothetical protein n=1 Tax=unclassified Caballeronia TaxID=2646786 RepID=UPI001F40B94E|nr:MULTISPECIES: hypothetical protein [unclassified Caballeronia]MCE4547666.1 hypothetical protein [Caballeronia sp. PC1]MCE4575123.1 hypothetical protein [Caballeronia sp. CLC5]
MKLSHIATVAVLIASCATSVAAIGLVVHGFKLERTAVPVVASTGLVERMQGVSDALQHVPANVQATVLQNYGFRDRKSFDDALDSQRVELARAQRLRAEALASNEKRLTALLIALVYTGSVAAMGALVLCDKALAKAPIRN